MTPKRSRAIAAVCTAVATRLGCASSASPPRARVVSAIACTRLGTSGCATHAVTAWEKSSDHSHEGSTNEFASWRRRASSRLIAPATPASSKSEHIGAMHGSKTLRLRFIISESEGTRLSSGG